MTREELHRRLKQYEHFSNRLDAGAVVALVALCAVALVYRTIVAPEPSQINIYGTTVIAIIALVVIAVSSNVMIKKKLRELRMACPECGSVFYAPVVTEIALTGKCSKCGAQILGDEQI